VALCPSCSEENPERAKFCLECGAPLAEAASALPLEERKIVSVLFCDLVGFTATSERQDPEDVRARLRPYHLRLRRDIERYGGTVEKFIGDAVMAVFGAPAAHEDDAERAVRAGLRILDGIAELNAETPGFGLQVRVGVNTGEAVVERAARVEQGEGFVAGDVVNTAARIQVAAPIGGVAVSDATYRATSRVFDYEPLEAADVKGKSSPLALWQARGPRARLGSDIGRHRTPLVGRELEKPLLIATFERAAQQRSVQLVTIVGEPGVGKSRLVAELAGYTDAKPELTRWRQGRCLPYGDSIAFWALAEIVKAEAGLLESDPAEVATAKLDATLDPEERERRWVIQRLATLVGLEPTQIVERQELFAAWRRFLEALAVSRPTVLVFEDLHWADEGLLDFLEYLLEWAQDVPLLVVCTARPELYERRPGWAAGLRNAQTINVAPLSDDETAELVSYLVRGSGVAVQVERAVVERSGGNPLYAEEFARLLEEARADTDTLIERELPDTVQALIAARLDTLSPQRKSLLQDAAVIGKVFWASAVAEIASADVGEVELALHDLARKELLRPARTSSIEGEQEYSFWHLLVRDVAYGQLPRLERSRRHRAAAAWIEQKTGQRPEDSAELLAYHYTAALDLARAAGNEDEAGTLQAPARRWLALAGERSLGLDAAQAEARLAQALELTPIDAPDRLDLLVRWGEAVHQLGRHREAAAALDEAYGAFRRRGDNEAASRALQFRARVAQRTEDGDAVALAAEAVALIEDQPGPTLIAALTQLVNTQSLTGAFEEAITTADRACSVAAELGLPEPLRAVGYRGYSRALRGDERGLSEMERVLAALTEHGGGRDIAAIQNNLALARYPLQGPARSLAGFEAGIILSNERGLVEAAAVLNANCPGLLMELGQTDEALARSRAIAAATAASGDTKSLIEVRAVEAAILLACENNHDEAAATWLAESALRLRGAELIAAALPVAAAVLARDQPERAASLISTVKETAGARDTPYWGRALPGMIRTALATHHPELAVRLADEVSPRYPLEAHALLTGRAAIAEHRQDYENAADTYARAAQAWIEFGHLPERATALLGHGRCLIALGNPNAEQALHQAHELFASMGYTAALTETQNLLNQNSLSTS
jgi:class 3 adenylate cyclase/tetratricopeptide (TPR) repeat protein